MNVTRRQRISVTKIDAVVRQIAERFRPEKIILFGSYARGDPRPESDIDLLVVLDTPLKEAEQAVRICQDIDYHFGLDLIVRTPQVLAHRLEIGDPFLKEVMSKGKTVYERADNRVDSKG